MTRGSRGKPKYVGSCGMYVFVHPDGDCSQPHLLVHRRSRQVSEPHTVAAPGGIVARALCGPSASGSDFLIGARTTAVRELEEETGLRIGAEVELGQLPAAPGAYWGEGTHANFCVTFNDFPEIVGPEKESLYEVVKGGLDGLGVSAGDEYHA
eukprot:TRINITY_DN29353_c0_g1_i1.p1 TRINITY_DN29353_c0_g1~~TRINITY_DN29353_c0_g1_i1.p1  ORF type:complete len:153 (-),score=23.08 TRINITY_DN29353_c0_g1_i1:4-462(-)